MDVMDMIIHLVERQGSPTDINGGHSDDAKSSAGTRPGQTEDGQWNGPVTTSSSTTVPAPPGANATESSTPSITTSTSEQTISEQPQYTPPTPSEFQTTNTQLESTQPLTKTTASATTPVTTTEATSAATSSTDSDAGASSSNLTSTSTQTKLAIALPIAIVGLVVIIVLIFFFLRRRRRQNTPPAYDIATSQRTAVSTSELMSVPKLATPEPAASSARQLPVFDVSQNHTREPSPGSTVRMNDSHTELGLAVTAPGDQRHSGSEHDLHRFGGTASRTSGTPRMPFETRHGDDDDDVSVVSDMNERRGREHDFDDMSSVSSFDEDEPRTDEHENQRGRS
ncbi:hypothetical protein N7532_007042 [Penicillium argentinense]|uniref:Mid2 domain-containing protein n=1 Tax=Penicillium argentinense TaxID=1131581 RepID=A0A9W9FH43_9EURO|nr:uncharacterized protein N7532_007042 [Penicillium argentinense]KAJ5100041.1 hypothetical protein N7532_007042 [Penicillium argentinense]